MAADGKTPPTHPQGGGGNIMCTCSIFVCRHKNNDMSTLLGHAHTYIPTDRQTDTQAYIHKSIQTYSYTYTWLHMCDVSPLWGGGWGGTRGGWIIYIFKYMTRGGHLKTLNRMSAEIIRDRCEGCGAVFIPFCIFSSPPFKRHILWILFCIIYIIYDTSSSYIIYIYTTLPSFPEKFYYAQAGANSRGSPLGDAFAFGCLHWSPGPGVVATNQPNIARVRSDRLFSS